MRNQVFLHLSKRQVSEFHTRWDEISNYLNKFPPFQPNQCFLDEQTKDILYTIILKHWQSYLQRDKFDIIGCSIRDFFDMMEHYQLADQLDPLLKQQNQLKTDKDDSKKSTEKSNVKNARPSPSPSPSPSPRKMILMCRRPKSLA
jgi:hypothetical protein